jgi:hypothetical protein
MNRSHWIPVAVSLFWIPIASAAETCPSDNAKVTPAPAELAKMCPQVKQFQEAPSVEGNSLQCIYNYALTQYGGGPKIPQAWLKVSSDPMNRQSPREVAEADAKEMTKQLIKQGMSSAVEKMPWTGIDAWEINSSMKGIKMPGDLFYVKTTKGVKTVHLKVMGKAPDCVEAVVRYVAHH